MKDILSVLEEALSNAYSSVGEMAKSIERKSDLLKQALIALKSNERNEAVIKAIENEID